MTDYKGSLHFSSPLPSVTDFILFYYQQTLPLRLGKPLVDPDFLPFRSKKKHLFYSCSCILTPKLPYNWLCWNHMSIPGPTSDLRGMDGMIGCSVGHRLSPVLSLGYSTVIGVQHYNPIPDKGKEFPKGKWRSGFKKKKSKLLDKKRYLSFCIPECFLVNWNFTDISFICLGKTGKSKYRVQGAVDCSVGLEYRVYIGE